MIMAAANESVNQLDNNSSSKYFYLIFEVQDDTKLIFTISQDRTDALQLSVGLNFYNTRFNFFPLHLF